MLFATHLNKDNDHGCSDGKLIKSLMDSADDLSSLWLVRTTYTWYKEYGLPCIIVLFEGLQTSAVPQADCREVVLSSLAAVVCFGFSLILLHRPATHRAGVRTG